LRKGRITKALSGFYYVTDDEKNTFQTRARGVFRKKKITPLVGDFVEFELDNNEEGIIQNIFDRKNELDRPSVSNIDLGVIIVSAVNPAFSTQLLDRFLVQLEHSQIQPAIYLAKTDLLSDEDKNDILNYKDYYESIGYSFIIPDGAEAEKFKELFADKLVVFMGQSGAGKSTLLNHLNPIFNLKTAEISSSLGRGKHTTRHVELLSLFNGLVADTPGFSSLTLNGVEKEELAECFPEMWERRAECKFAGCLHYKEPGCAVKEAVSTGEITEYRYKNYILFLEEIINRKPDYRKDR